MTSVHMSCFIIIIIILIIKRGHEVSEMADGRRLVVRRESR